MTGAPGERERSERRRETRVSGRGAETSWWDREDRAEENWGQEESSCTGRLSDSFRRKESEWMRSGEREVVV